LAVADVPDNGIAAIRAGLQGSDREGVPQRVRGGPRTPCPTGQADFFHGRTEGLIYIDQSERISSRRHEHVLAEGA
jgi:hypothetical protein